MLNIIKKYPSLIFIYQDNLFGDFTIIEEEEERVRQQIELFMLHNLPEAADKVKESHDSWKKRALESTKRASEVIKEIQKHNEP